MQFALDLFNHMITSLFQTFDFNTHDKMQIISERAHRFIIIVNVCPTSVLVHVYTYA